MKIEFQDKIIVCRVCGEEFLWSSGEQEFYYDRELSQPTKCKDCREHLRRKSHRQQEERQAREVNNDRPR